MTMTAAVQSNSFTNSALISSDRLPYFPKPDESTRLVMQRHPFAPPTRANNNNNSSDVDRSSTTNTLSAPAASYVSQSSWTTSSSSPAAPSSLPQPRALPGIRSLCEPVFPSASRPLPNALIQSSEAPAPVLARPAHGVPPFGSMLGRLPDPPTYSQSSTRSSVSDTSTNIGSHSTFTATETPRAEAQADVSSGRTANSRCHLYIRQQPRAARAGPDGKDRRVIDPPPIVQLMMDDFNPDSEADVEELQSQWWVVYCSLVAAHSPDTNVTTMSLVTDDGRTELQRLLLGTHVANATPTTDDPDPPTMPLHPITKPAPIPAPPSPTSRFLPASSRSTNRAQREPHQIPGAFFIFADLSVRKAGEYRLRFDLMKLATGNLVPGSSVPCTDRAISQVFRVVNAKDFDQVQPSTNLVRGLLERGAGFPLKLKKGTREGQRRRRRQSEQDSDDDSNLDDNYD